MRRLKITRKRLAEFCGSEKPWFSKIYNCCYMAYATDGIIAVRTPTASHNDSKYGWKIAGVKFWRRLETARIVPLKRKYLTFRDEFCVYDFVGRGLFRVDYLNKIATLLGLLVSATSASMVFKFDGGQGILLACDQKREGRP